MLSSPQEPENGVDAEETDKVLAGANASVVSMYGSVSAWLLVGLVAALAGSTALYLGLSGEHRTHLMPCRVLLGQLTVQISLFNDCWSRSLVHETDVVTDIMKLGSSLGSLSSHGQCSCSLPPPALCRASVQAAAAISQHQQAALTQLVTCMHEPLASAWLHHCAGLEHPCAGLEHTSPLPHVAPASMLQLATQCCTCAAQLHRSAMYGCH